MDDDVKNIFDRGKLLKAPVRRPAYSDRTAWLMSAMSELAYYKFEKIDAIGEMVEDIAKGFLEDKSSATIRMRVEKFLEKSQVEKNNNQEILKEVLASIEFDLINTYCNDGTQGFLAYRKDVEAPMLILAFRGTETDCADIREVIKDIKSDLKANLVNIVGEEKIHKGFLDAFKLVKDEIEQDLTAFEDVPLFITGHSLGGALSVVATRFLGSESHGACYTFGGPRVGNEELAERIKTPIYRVVNSADAVPRLPPSFFITIVIEALRWTPLPWLDKAADILEKNYRGYVHYGDMRYLTHVEPGMSDEFLGLKLISNPSFFERLRRLIPRLAETGFKAAGTDHFINLYRRKLGAHASRRN